MKKGNGKLIEGILAGAVLGAIAGIFLAPESGKNLRKDIKKRTAEFYKHLIPNLRKIKKIGEQEYKELVKKAAQRYAKSKKISKKETDDLIKEAHKSWTHLTKHLGK
ncbi:MAG: YtxH domain-containing protein [Candidatus Brennerbacteria bacterium]|nr:YtxH domain-containing protein [Candidatus Brennerbacteria bacterium]